MYCVSCEVRTEFIYVMQKKVDRLCGLVVRVPGYRSGGPGSIPGATRFFWEVVGLERGPLSFVSTTEEPLGRKSSGSGLENRKYGRKDQSRWPRGALYQQKLAITLPTSGGRSVGIVRSRTQTMEFFYGISLTFVLYIEVLLHVSTLLGLHQAITTWMCYPLIAYWYGSR
jgi:hypothetical protein